MGGLVSSCCCNCEACCIPIQFQLLLRCLAVRHPRLFIDSHLEECSVSHVDTSFEEGYVGPSPSDDPFSSQSFSSKVHIDSLEIFAVGDEETIRKGFKAQYQHRDIADATLRNARTVDKAAFLGDMRNGIVETKVS